MKDARVLDTLLSVPLDTGTAGFDPSTLEFTSIDTDNPAFNVIPAEVKARFNARFNDLHTARSLQVRITRQIEARRRLFKLADANGVILGSTWTHPLSY